MIPVVLIRQRRKPQTAPQIFNLYIAVFLNLFTEPLTFSSLGGPLLKSNLSGVSGKMILTLVDSENNAPLQCWSECHPYRQLKDH